MKLAPQPLFLLIYLYHEVKGKSTNIISIGLNLLHKLVRVRLPDLLFYYRLSIGQPFIVGERWWKMSKLNLKQQAFADEYIITGNAYQSALKAGYKENYAKNAQEKLVEKGGKVSEYIKNKLKEIQLERHLTMEEALAITASIAKGEPQRFEKVLRDPETNEIIEREVSEYSAGFKERNQALEHFYKINAAFIDKQQIEVTETPVFVDDLGDDDG